MLIPWTVAKHLAEHLVKNSWCSWQKAKPPIPCMNIRISSSTTYFRCNQANEELNRDELLSRYDATNLVGGSKICFKCFKVILDIAATTVVCVYNVYQYNDECIIKIMEILDMIIGLNCYNFCAETDATHQVFGDIAEWRKRGSTVFKISQKGKRGGENVNLEGLAFSIVWCRLELNKKFLLKNAT